LTENWEQNCCQDRDNRDHDQQFNERETDPMALNRCPSVTSAHRLSLLATAMLARKDASG
jgi:hypothetical protein